MRRYRVTVDGRTYDVEIDDPRARPVIARLDGDTFVVEVESGVQRDAPPPAAIGGGTTVVPVPVLTAPGADVLTAPIPGTVVKVVATAGSVVQRGDDLLTIEAMKMFNVIRSPRPGTIKTVHVGERARVAQGDPLVTFVA